MFEHIGKVIDISAVYDSAFGLKLNKEFELKVQTLFTFKLGVQCWNNGNFICDLPFKAPKVIRQTYE